MFTWETHTEPKGSWKLWVPAAASTPERTISWAPLWVSVFRFRRRRVVVDLLTPSASFLFWFVETQTCFSGSVAGGDGVFITATVPLLLFLFLFVPHAGDSPPGFTVHQHWRALSLQFHLGQKRHGETASVGKTADVISPCSSVEPVFLIIKIIFMLLCFCCYQRCWFIELCFVLLNNLCLNLCCHGYYWKYWSSNISVTLRTWSLWWNHSWKV